MRARNTHCESSTERVVGKGKRRAGKVCHVPCHKPTTHGIRTSHDDGVTWHDHGSGYCAEHAVRHGKTYALAEVFSLTDANDVQRFKWDLE